MSIIISTYHTIDICCPHCDEYNEIEDLDISTTIWGTDIARKTDECVFNQQCEYCGEYFKVIPHLNIEIEKV